MTIKTSSSPEFNQAATEVKRTAIGGAVLTTDCADLSDVVVVRIADLLAMLGIADIELEIPISHELVRAADFS